MQCETSDLILPRINFDNPSFEINQAFSNSNFGTVQNGQPVNDRFANNEQALDVIARAEMTIGYRGLKLKLLKRYTEENVFQL